MRADILFLGVEGIDISGGMTIPDVIEAHTDKAMVKSAGQTVVVADHSKLGRNALSTIASVDRIDLIISDKGAPEQIVEQLREQVKIHLV